MSKVAEMAVPADLAVPVVPAAMVVSAAMAVVAEVPLNSSLSAGLLLTDLSMQTGQLARAALRVPRVHPDPPAATGLLASRAEAQPPRVNQNTAVMAETAAMAALAELAALAAPVATAVPERVVPSN